MSVSRRSLTAHPELQRLVEAARPFLQDREVRARGLRPAALAALVEAGVLERVQPGLYRRVDAPALPHESLVELALRVPRGVVCLTSALDVHGLGTQRPSSVHLALPRGAYRPAIVFPPVRYHGYSQASYAFDVHKVSEGDHAFQVYSSEKTLADLLQHEKTVGRDVYLEALKAYLARPARDLPAVLEAARVNRVEAAMRRDLEALV